MVESEKTVTEVSPEESGQVEGEGTSKDRLSTEDFLKMDIPLSEKIRMNVLMNFIRHELYDEECRSRRYNEIEQLSSLKRKVKNDEEEEEEEVPALPPSDEEFEESDNDESQSQPPTPPPTPPRPTKKRVQIKAPLPKRKEVKRQVKNLISKPPIGKFIFV